MLVDLVAALGGLASGDFVNAEGRVQAQGAVPQPGLSRGALVRAENLAPAPGCVPAGGAPPAAWHSALGPRLKAVRKQTEDTNCAFQRVPRKHRGALHGPWAGPPVTPAERAPCRSGWTLRGRSAPNGGAWFV